MIFGCTGHQKLGRQTRRVVAAAVATLLAERGGSDVVGVSSLAEGADQLFALSVLAAGGALNAVVPSLGYEGSFISDDARGAYVSLLKLAANVQTMNYDQPCEDAYLAAGHTVANSCELLIAVWDGKTAAGKGGTGDIVKYARDRGVAVEVVWPAGASRT